MDPTDQTSKWQQIPKWWHQWPYLQVQCTAESFGWTDFLALAFSCCETTSFWFFFSVSHPSLPLLRIPSSAPLCLSINTRWKIPYYSFCKPRGHWWHWNLVLHRSVCDRLTTGFPQAELTISCSPPAPDWPEPWPRLLKSPTESSSLVFRWLHSCDCGLGAGQEVNKPPVQPLFQICCLLPKTSESYANLTLLPDWRLLLAPYTSMIEFN